MITNMTNNNDIKFCCEDFKKAINNYNFDFGDGKYWIFGYDMDEDYPPLIYCPTCGKKLVYFEGMKRSGNDGTVLK